MRLELRNGDRSAALLLKKRLDGSVGVLVTDLPSAKGRGGHALKCVSTYLELQNLACYLAFRKAEPEAGELKGRHIHGCRRA